VGVGGLSPWLMQANKPESGQDCYYRIASEIRVLSALDRRGGTVSVVTSESRAYRSSIHSNKATITAKRMSGHVCSST
jgi:hypothetical protein